MSQLLGNEYAPLTFAIAFLESDLESASSALMQVPGSHSRRITAVRGRLPELFTMLEPITWPHTKWLLIGTKSSWTAVFENRVRGADLNSAIYNAGRLIGCRSLDVTAIPNISFSKDRRGVYGATMFALRDKTGSDIRHIHVMNDAAWKFFANGEPLPFEHVGCYAAKRIRDRFTPEMLDEYVRALGVDVFNPEFYEPDARIIAHRHSYDISESMSLATAQYQMRLTDEKPEEEPVSNPAGYVDRVLGWMSGRRS